MTIVQCDSPGRILAHEMGHLQGLADVRGTSCLGFIMGPTPAGSTATVRPEECQAADEQWETPLELRFPDPGDDPQPCPTPEQCSSPVVIDLLSNGFRFTSLAGGVRFDIDGDGVVDRVAWTDPRGDEAFLVLDRNGNGRIDGGRELFGDSTAQPFSRAKNGFHALWVFDQPEFGGDGDGWITVGDEIFPRLRLWRDTDHDGVSRPWELLPLPFLGVRGIALEHATSERVDRHGNRLRYKAMVDLALHRRPAACDVFFVREAPEGDGP